MKSRILGVTIGLLVGAQAWGATTGHRISEFPNRSTLASNMLFVVEDVGVTNYNISWGQMTNQVSTMATTIASNSTHQVTSSNLFLAGPSNNAAAAPAMFRPIDVSDIASGLAASSSTYLRGDWTWSAVAGASGGTVTSVGQTGDGVIFSNTVPGSPVTSSGTLVPGLLKQTANTVLAGPTSGSTATPTFRSLVSADLPAFTVPETNVTVVSGSPLLSRWAGRRIMASQYGNSSGDTTGQDFGWEPAFGGLQSEVAASATAHGYHLLTTSATTINVGECYFQPFHSDAEVPKSKPGVFTWRIAMTNAASVRFWVGLSSLGQTFFYDSETPSGWNAAIFKFSTNSANWFFITSDGSALTATDTGVAGNNSNVALTVELTGGNPIAYINGVAVATNSSHLPLTALMPVAVMTTLATQRNAWKLYGFYGEQDW